MRVTSEKAGGLASSTEENPPEGWTPAMSRTEWKDEECDAALGEIERFCNWFAAECKKALAREDVKENEYRQLAVVIAGEAKRLGKLAERVRQDAGQVGRVWNGMEKKGWVLLERGNKDQRERALAVTDAGNEVFELCKEQRRNLVRRFLFDVGAGRRKEIIAMFQDLNQRGEDMQVLVTDAISRGGRRLEKGEAGTKKRKPHLRRKGRGGVRLSGRAGVEVETEKGKM
jgi:DNA-binding MarR family transcriptional regulator